MIYIVGLGNPGKEYENTRHSAGRVILEIIRTQIEAEDFRLNKKLKALVSEGEIGKQKVTLMVPETFMNNSGLSVKSIITSVKKAHSLVVIYDDLDLPIGTMKISFNRGTGGHKGLDSITTQIKTAEFVRFRVGISPKTATGKTKKPSGAAVVEKHIMGEFHESEMVELKKIGKKAVEALEIFVRDGLQKTMSVCN